LTLLHDFQGRRIRLTAERLAHILEHPEMSEFAKEIGETVKQPERVLGSLSDPQARLYYRFYSRTPVGQKYLCVVARVLEEDAFVLTAYLTDKLKEGVPIWPRET